MWLLAQNTRKKGCRFSQDIRREFLLGEIPPFLKNSKNPFGSMKMKNPLLKIASSVLFLAIFAMAADSDHRTQPVRSIATALDHLTVLEYDEAVKEAAIGSSAFEVERTGNKVFIKPLRPGACTNLFVWTVSNQQYAYELSVTDVSQMNAEVRVVSKPLPQPDKNAEIQKASEIAVSRALTDVQKVDGSSIKTPKGKIGIRIEEIVHTDKTIYIRYVVENRKSIPYQLTAPALYQLSVEHAAINLTSLKGKQVDPRIIMKNPDEARVLVATIQNSSEVEMIPPGARKEGLLAIPRTDDPAGPNVIELALPGNVQAVVVL